MKSPSIRAVLLRLALALCLVGTSVFLWRAWSSSAGQEGAAPSAPAVAPSAPPAILVNRHPVEEPVAAPAQEVPPAQEPTWAELNNDATQLLTEGDLPGAVERFERCFAAVPANPVFLSNLAEALVRLARQEHARGELAAAVEHLARAIEVAPQREDIDVLRKILERWRQEAQLGENDWTEASNHFQLSFDTDRTDILHHSHEVLEHLELGHADLVRWFGEDPFEDGPPIRVVLYGHEDFDRLTGLGDWAAGVFDGVVRVSVSDLAKEGWRAVLGHELVHAFVQALGGTGVPGWLNEGLAQMLEAPADPPRLARLAERLRGQELFPLEQLTGSLAGWKDSGEIARAYAESLLFVDYLHRVHGDEALRRMVKGVAAGRTPAQAFEEWISTPLELAFQDWREALRR